MNVAFSNRPQEFIERLEMVDNPESHCIAFLKSQERKWESKFPDPEEIRALTRNMKREHWEIPNSVPRDDAFAIARAYLDEFGSLKATELERFGIKHLIGFAREPDIKAETLHTESAHCTIFYTYA